jgi:DNA invertase Pin-like site-specific DNA recombinase
MKKYFGYIRVSTAKQGEQGSSLQEQKAAIEAYALRHGLNIVEWYEELETAAAQGRPVFNRMLKAIERKAAHGVITHKIDRSARNLKDWAHIGELVERGVEMHFAHESLDLMSRSGRLSADILAVVASDYIRNLRDEVRKGFYGRLKQGLYPLKAPIGYLDQGGGKPKLIDPVRGPLVAKAFELYATGQWSVVTLSQELHRRGLRNRTGKRLSKNGISTMLNHPFYVGILKIRKTGETFPGCHAPLVDQATFDAVQSVLKGRMPHQSRRRRYRYQRLIRCAGCGYHLIAERQKGRVYYRCHTAACPLKCIREDAVDHALQRGTSKLVLSEPEWNSVRSDIDQHFETTQHDVAQHRKALELAIASIDNRQATLTDAVLDGIIDRSEYLARKERILLERADLLRRHKEADGYQAAAHAHAIEILELAKTASLLPQVANDEELRRIVKATTLNLSVHQRNIVIAWREPFRTLVNASADPCSGLHRDNPRTSGLAQAIITYAETAAKHDAANDNHARDNRLAA